LTAWLSPLKAENSFPTKKPSEAVATRGGARLPALSPRDAGGAAGSSSSTSSNVRVPLPMPSANEPKAFGAFRTPLRLRVAGLVGQSERGTRASKGAKSNPIDFLFAAAPPAKPQHPETPLAITAVAMAPTLLPVLANRSRAAAADGRPGTAAAAL
jgi:hypothetical protein